MILNSEEFLVKSSREKCSLLQHLSAGMCTCTRYGKQIQRSLTELKNVPEI